MRSDKTSVQKNPKEKHGARQTLVTSWKSMNMTDCGVRSSPYLRNRHMKSSSNTQTHRIVQHTNTQTHRIVKHTNTQTHTIVQHTSTQTHMLDIYSGPWHTLLGTHVHGQIGSLLIWDFTIYATHLNIILLNQGSQWPIVFRWNSCSSLAWAMKREGTSSRHLGSGKRLY